MGWRDGAASSLSNQSTRLLLHLLCVQTLNVFCYSFIFILSRDSCFKEGARRVVCINESVSYIVTVLSNGSLIRLQGI